MTQTTANLQGQIVSNGSVITLGGKPCIIRSADDNGGYLSTYAPNNGVTVKGVFYVGKNTDIKSSLFGSDYGNEFSFVSESGSDRNPDRNVTVNLTKINKTSVMLSDRNDVYDATDSQFLLYRQVDFNFLDNVLGLGYRKQDPLTLGMYTFQELVIFENIDDISAKENNVNSRYNLY